MNPDAELLGQAIDLACENVRTGAGGPFGALVARGGRVVATGVNEVTRTPDPTAHAEVQAIRAAALALGTHDLSGLTLYTSCEPCPLCRAATLWARLDRVLFAATSETAALAGFDDSAFHDLMPAQTPWPVEFRRFTAETGRWDGRPFDLWERSRHAVAY